VKPLAFDCGKPRTEPGPTKKADGNVLRDYVTVRTGTATAVEHVTKSRPGAAASAQGMVARVRAPDGTDEIPGDTATG